MLSPLSNAEVRKHKATAQRLKAMLKMGRQGLSLQFLQSVDEALKHHELIKVKFDEFKDQRKKLAPELAEKSGSHLVSLVGNVVVLYRPRPSDPSPHGAQLSER
jgi:RNA-binding protein